MKWVQAFFKFSPNERRGITALVVLITLLLYFRYRHQLITLFYPDPIAQIEDQTHIKQENTVIVPKSKKVNSEKKNKSYAKSKNKGRKKPPPSDSKRYTPKKKTIDKPSYQMIHFDPNQVDSMSLIKMGVNKFAIRNWMKFRRKGGSINSAEKLQSIYGLKPSEFERLKDFIQLPERKIPTKKSKYTSVELAFESIEINSATAQELQKIKGIGPVFSERIVKYRNLLGGFRSLRQMKEVYGIDDSLFQVIKPFMTHKDNSVLQSIRVNELSQDSLKKHPYISWKQAKLIVSYRDQHGAFSNEEEFRKLRFLKEDDFKRMIPYLDFDTVIDVSLSNETKG